ncbi:hypothetical protein L7F22_062308 [Adiantum nelumboides]|nr:hypothetical protein [Adiantum nelumboides]
MIKSSATLQRSGSLLMVGDCGTLKRRSTSGEQGTQVQVVSSRRRRMVMVARLGGAYMERALGAVGYVLPLLDGMQYGRYVFAQYPASEALFRPLFPLLRLYSSIPFSNFVFFFTLYLALVRNPSFGRFVRFNAMQACVLDVLIVLPLIAQRILSPRSGLGLDLLVIFYNSIFVALLAAVVFAVVSCLLGKTPRLPIVADAAENQLF